MAEAQAEKFEIEVVEQYAVDSDTWFDRDPGNQVTAGAKG
jgi:hypothetical protein